MSIKPVFLIAKTIDEMYFFLLLNLYKHGRKNHIDNGSFAGSNRLEFDYVAGTIEYPTTRPLAPVFPDGVSPVTTDDDIEKYFINYIMDSTLENNDHYKYATWITGGKYHLPKVSGKQLKGTDGQNLYYDEIYDLTVNVPNQVQWCIDHYKKKGLGNNHCYIQVGYPESSFAYDIPYSNETDRQTSPCLRGIDTHIKNSRLHFAVTFRSWDLYAAFPTNMGGITMLLEYIANELGVKTGTLSFSCLKLHSYDFQIEALKKRLFL
jgi:thymidylate synthase